MELVTICLGRVIQSLAIGFIFVFSNISTAQNIVPNPGFENKTGCPGTLGGINFVQDWFSPISTTPDYFNTCSNMPAVTGIPQNTLGYQGTKDGDAYTGIIAYTSNTPFYAEYVTAKLTDTLIGGLNYDISFNVSLANNNNYRLVAISKIGAHLSKEPPTSVTTHLKVPYSIVNPASNFLSDTSSWMPIIGTYKAKGGEAHITIGCFDDGGIIDTQHVTNTAAADASYYYIDVVSVSVSCDTVSNSQLIHACNEVPFNIDLKVNHPSYMQNGVWSTNQNDSSISISNTGTYWYRSTFGCYTITDTFHVVDFKDRVTGKYDTTVCESEIDKLFLSSIPDATSYQWNTGSTEPTIKITSVGQYWCKTIKDCILYFDEYSVKTDSYIDKAALGTDQKFCKNEISSITLGRTFDSSVTTYKWNTGDTNCCILVNQPGKYILTISNECAESTDTIEVAVQDDCSDCLFIPTAFTPNNDGLNDKYAPIPKCPIGKYEIRIFNRWGQLLFKTNELAKKWDGKQNGQNVDLGTYHYQIIYKTDVSESEYLKKGDITLIR